MKQSEFKKCAICRKGMMHAGAPFFYRAEISQMVMNLRAVQRQHGLETMLGGNAALAGAFGLDEDLAQPVTTVSVLICSDCALTERLPLAVILDGESGPNARPMHPDRARSLRDQCAAAGVAFFLKQMARKAPIPPDLMVREWPK